MEIPDVAKGEGSEDDDFVTIIPSDYYQQWERDPLIDFSRYDSTAWVKLEDAPISDLPQFNGRQIEQSIEPFVKEYNKVRYDDVFTNVPQLVYDFAQYLLNLTFQKAAYQVAANWPPLIPRATNAIPSFVILCAKVLKELKDPLKFFYFLEQGLWQKNWTTKSCLINQYLVAICRCTIDKKSDPCFAYIDRDRNFCVYQVMKDGLKNLLSTTPGKTQQNSEKTLIHVYGFDGKQICDIVPYEEEQIQLWDLIYSKQKVPFPFYLTSVDEYMPPIMYRAFYNALTANDMIMIDGIMRTDIFDPDMWESIVKIYAHAQKVQFLAEAVILHHIKDLPKLDTDFFEQNSHMKLFFRGLGKAYWHDYYSEFFNKIVFMIDGHDDLELSDISLVDVKVCEKLLFNVLNLITKSIAYIPQEWRFVASILRSYTMVKWNSKAMTHLALSGMIGRCIICSFLEEPNKWIRDIPLQHPDNFPVFSFLLTIPFSLNVYGGNTKTFAPYNRRLEKHFFPRMYQFVIAMSDITETYLFETPSNDALGWALDVVMRKVCNTEAAKPIKERLIQFMDQNIRETTTVGYNFCVILSNLFVHKFDASESMPKKGTKVKVKTKPITLPNLKMYGAGASSGFGGGGGGGGMGSAFSSPSKGGKRAMPTVTFQVDLDDDKPVVNGQDSIFIPGRPQVRERAVRYLPPESHKMSLPAAPPATNYNPINAVDAESSTDSEQDTIMPGFTPPKRQESLPRNVQVKRIDKRIDDREFISSDSEEPARSAKPGQRPPPGLPLPPGPQNAPIPQSQVPKKGLPSVAFRPPPAPRAPPAPSATVTMDDTATAENFDDFLEPANDDSPRRPRAGAERVVRLTRVDPSEVNGQQKLYKKVPKSNASDGSAYKVAKKDNGNKYVVKKI